MSEMGQRRPDDPETPRFIATFMERSGGVSPSMSQIATGIRLTSRGSVHRYARVEEISVDLAVNQFDGSPNVSLR
jgi:hypothetical protein